MDSVFGHCKHKVKQLKKHYLGDNRAPRGPSQRNSNHALESFLAFLWAALCHVGDQLKTGSACLGLKVVSGQLVLLCPLHASSLQFSQELETSAWSECQKSDAIIKCRV